MLLFKKKGKISKKFFVPCYYSKRKKGRISKKILCHATIQKKKKKKKIQDT